ncbi:MAG: carbohydrate ABC transporter permease, partial [Microbacterium sp.]|nr:carbohydrate ABC transporter permease [Microbacterium sp.]
MRMTALSTPHRRSRVSLSGWSGRTIGGLLLLLFVLFFVIPIVWLLLAVTKSSHELVVGNPFSPGSWADFTANWNQLFSFQD